MKVTYEPESDVLRILLSNATIEKSDKDKTGIIIDYDKDGDVVGMEYFCSPHSAKLKERLVRTTYL